MATDVPNLTEIAPESASLHGYFLQQGVVLALIAGVGQLSNLVTIITYAASPKLKTASNVFIVNLCIADSLFLACSWPAVVTLLHYQGERFIGPGACFVTAFLIALGGITSIETIGAIAITRYIGIVRPEWKSALCTRRKCVISSIMLWIYSFVLMIPTFTRWGSFAYLDTHFHCTFDWGHNIWYSVALFVLCIGISNVAVIFCYAKIYYKFRLTKQRLHDLSSAEDSGTLMAQAARRGHQMERRLALQLLIIYLIFNICWLPYLIYALFINPQGDGSIIVYHISQLLIFLNSSVNPFLYLYFNRTFRTEIARIFFRCKYPNRTENTHYMLDSGKDVEAGSDWCV